MGFVLPFRIVSRFARRASTLIAICWFATACDEDTGTPPNTGSGNDSGALGNSTVPCVDVSHVAGLQREDLRVVGTGFEEYEGLMMRLVVTIREPNYGLGEAPIENGGFDLTLPGVLSDYTGIALYVDRVRNDACDPDDETLWQMTSGPLSALGPAFTATDGGPVLMEVTPDRLRIFPQAGPCNLNGIFDLQIPLTCRVAD